MAVKITSVEPGSPARCARIHKGDTLISINGNPITDVLDYQFYTTDEHLEILLCDEEKKVRTVLVEKDEYDDLGLQFETYLMDRARSCANNCIFCFVDQMPPGMRETLYFKDETLSEDGTPPKAMRNHECGVMRKLSTLRSYFDFLFKAERISSNIAALVSLPKLHEKPILYLINEEVDRLLSVASDGAALTERQQKFHKLTKTRDVAILMLFLGTGMRVSECVGVNIDDLDFHLNAVLVTRKGGNQVILYFPQEVADALKAYLEERKLIQTDKANENALFLSLQKKRMTQRAVQIMVKKYCAIAVPLKKRMSPHKLRSTYATRLYHETEDIYLVADALGHSDVNTTRKHYAAMSDQRRREAARNVHLPEMDNQTNTNDENRLKMEKQAGKTPEMDS